MTHTTGVPKLDKLIEDFGNAIFDCGDWRDPRDDEDYLADGKYVKYEDAMAEAEKARTALYAYLRDKFSVNQRGDL